MRTFSTALSFILSLALALLDNVNGAAVVDDRMPIRSWRDPDCAGAGGVIRLTGGTQGCYHLLNTTECITFAHGSTYYYTRFCEKG